MKVTAIGHAGLFVETAAGSILCDPWVHPAYFASWFPFPDNSGLDWERYGRADHLFVSHLHHDHFDPVLLRQRVSKDATVLLPDFPLDEMERALRDLGFHRFVHSSNDTPFELDGLRLMITALTSPSDGPIGDSALAVDDGTARLFNQNDARPLGFDAITEFGSIDAHFLQFSGAIWWPMVYDLKPKAKAGIAADKRRNGMERALRYADRVGAAYVFPSAGPPCFLDPELLAHNDVGDDEANIFPDQLAFLTFMADKGHDNGRLLVPGATAELTHGDSDASCSVTSRPDDPEVAAVFGNKGAYLRAYAERQAHIIETEKAGWAAPGIDVFGELQRWFEPLMELGDHFCAGIGAAVLLLVAGDPAAAAGDPRAEDLPVVLDFPNRQVRAPADGEKCRYRFRVSRPLVERLVADQAEDWVNTLFLGMRFEAHRAGPYNEYLYTWFKCLSPERLEYAEGWYAEQANDDEDVTLNGWCLQRRCPHLKADLTHFGEIDNQAGTLTCRMHQWRWDLASGRCLTSAGHELRAKPQPPGSGVAGDAIAHPATPERDRERDREGTGSEG